MLAQKEAVFIHYYTFWVLKHIYSTCNQLKFLVQAFFTNYQLLYSGDVWPGPCVFPDFTQSSARSWWAQLVKGFISNGVDGIWNDMNEPAVFKVKSKLFCVK